MTAAVHSSRARYLFGLQLLTLSVVLIPLSLGGWWVWQKHQQLQAQLDQITPRHARLLGLRDSKAELDKAQAAVQQQLATRAYAAEQDPTQVGNEAQQRIRTLFADSKLDIGSIQVLPPKEGKAFDRISIVLKVEGDLVGLHNALSMLQTQTPAVWLDGFSIQTIGSVKPKSAQKLGAQFNLSVMRSRA